MSATRDKKRRRRGDNRINLRAIIEDYARHQPLCEYVVGKCDCGLTERLHKAGFETDGNGEPL